MVIKGYLDESEDGEWFSLGCVFSNGTNWTWLQVDWERCLEKWNKRLSNSGRPTISRYHASDCWTRNNDFKGFTVPERDDFLADLRSVIESTDGLHSISFSLRTKELGEVFGLSKPKQIKAASYRVLLQYLMLQMGGDVDGKPGYNQLTVPLIHDRTTHYDAVIQRAFFEMKDDTSFRHRGIYTTIVPMCWQDCIALQAADMVAYECRKQAIRTTSGGDIGGEIKKLLDLPTFGGNAFYFKKDNIVEVRDILKLSVSGLKS